jgi:hypothetical protein
MSVDMAYAVAPAMPSMYQVLWPRRVPCSGSGRKPTSPDGGGLMAQNNDLTKFRTSKSLGLHGMGAKFLQLEIRLRGP